MAAADVEKQGTGEIAVWLITAWFIWTVLFISTFISAFVIFRMNQEPWEGTDSAVLSAAIVVCLLRTPSTAQSLTFPRSGSS
jgi:hypothetical protein